MSESSAKPAPNLLWEITRYVIVAVAAGFLIWYTLLTPPVYDNRECDGKTMGTAYKVNVTHFPETGDWQKVANAIQAKLDTLDKMMSTYRSDSEVCRFNAFTSTEEWFPVSPETAQVVHVALEIAPLSEGAFDITIAPLVRHWGFGAGSREHLAGSFEELKAEAARLKEHTGYDKLSVRLDPPALKKSVPELTIDLSAIAKGFAVDCIAELLDAHKIANYLIEVGVEVRGKGRNNKDNDWFAGIEKPWSEQFSGIQKRFPLTNQSVATSGSYLQYRNIDGHSVSHLIDPRSGLPAQIGEGTERLVSAAVLAPNCTQADAWATAMFVLGEQKGLELANRQKVAALFLLQTGDAIREVASDAWKK